MNKYEKLFFSKFIPEWSEVKYIVHEHIIVIVWKLFLMLCLFVIIPSFLYFQSLAIRNLIPFYILEIYLIIVYIKIVYDIFNRYNDAWIITESSVIDLKWALFHIKVNSVNFESIEWIEVEQNWIIDTILWKWTLIIHKIWEELFVLNEAKIPFEALDEIEKIREEKKEDPEKEEKDKFELIMEALTWVVNQYLETSTGLKKKEIEKKSIEDDVKWKKWTIDLR